MTYRPLPEGLTIRESKIEGLGLFATSDFEAGQILGVTHICSVNQEIGDTFDLRWIRTPLGGFYNHSDTPNCETVFALNQNGIDYISLKTLRKIWAGEELTTEYKLYQI